MAEFAYFVVASILHDEESVERIFSRYEPLFSKAGGRRIRIEGPTAEAPDLPLVIFVLTGGTEGQALKTLDALGPDFRRRPVLLAAHPQHNSLPAALEILARFRQDGGSGSVALLRSPDDAASASELSLLVKAAAASLRMASLRIGAVGAPSEWLVASSQGPEVVSSSWGATMVDISIAELRDRIAAVRRRDAAPDEAARSFWADADSRSGPDEGDLTKSYTIYRALEELAQERRLDALTLRCFDLVTLDGATGCYALSRLADEGIDAGCEGDVPSILGLAWMRALAGEPAWMANPASIDVQKGTLLLAHCTVPRRGLSGYGIRTHFESGLGVAVAGTIPAGPITLARIGGKDLREVWLAEGEVVESPRAEGLCRTQIVVRAEGEKLRDLLERPLGNHLVVAQGAWAGAAERYLALSRP